MSEQFPLFRLATLLARQLSSPIASRIKEYARVHPRLAGAVCMRLGRTYRHLDTRFKLWMLRLHRPRHPAPISDATALNEGADVLGITSLLRRDQSSPCGGVLLALRPGVTVKRQRELESELGEVVIFSLGAAIIIFEVNRQANIQEAKKLEAVSRWRSVRLQLEELVSELALQERELERLHAELARVADARQEEGGAGPGTDGDAR